MTHPDWKRLSQGRSKLLPHPPSSPLTVLNCGRTSLTKMSLQISFVAFFKKRGLWPQDTQGLTTCLQSASEWSRAGEQAWPRPPRGKGGQPPSQMVWPLCHHKGGPREAAASSWCSEEGLAQDHTNRGGRVSNPESWSVQCPCDRPLQPPPKPTPPGGGQKSDL